MARDTISVKQIEYKNAELVLCEFMAVEWDGKKYEDINLQEFHDFIADKIEALDAYIITRKPWMYKTRWQ